MKNIARLIIAAAVAIFATACTAQPIDAPQTDNTLTFTASLSQPTKAAISSGKVSWEAGDQVAVSDGTTKEVVTVVASDISSDGATAKIKTSTLNASASTYYAVFPASRYSSLSAGKVVLTSSATQSEATQKPAVASCSGSSKTFRFKNVASMLRFETSKAFAKAVITAEGSAVAAGLTVDPSTGECSATQSAVSTATYTPSVPAAGEHYIELAPDNTLSSFVIDLLDASNAPISRFEYSSALSTSRGKIFTISNFDSRSTTPQPGDPVYVKVTSAPSDWSGQYILVHENGTNAKVFGGKDEKGSYVSTTIDNGQIKYASGMAVLEISQSGSGWAIKIAQGNNEGSYLYGSSGANKINFGSSPSANSLAISGGSAVITSNTAIMRFNTSADMFRYYKSSSASSMDPIQLYRLSSSVIPTPPTPPTPEPTVTTGAATAITADGATLEGSWANATETTYEHRIEYGRSASNLDQVIYYNGTTGSSGSFKLQVTDLAASTTYYYRAVVQMGDNDVYGEIKSFTTLAGPNPYTSTGWAELPVMYDSDKNGICDNDNTLYYAKHMCAGGEKGPGGVTARNYTVCFSATHHCPLWVAAPRHSMYTGSAGRNDSYKADPDIPSSIQYKSKDTGAGCNKGHMLGSAERTSSVATNRQVFYYSNIAPQNGTTFNTGGGAWNNLEEYVDSKVCADTLYEVIGCYFDYYKDAYGNIANPSKISFGGRTDVSKPTMFYYALLRTKSGNSHKSVVDCSASELQCVAFVMSHEMQKGHKPQAQDMISISALEALTGVTYFPNVPNAPKSTFSASDWGL